MASPTYAAIGAITAFSGNDGPVSVAKPSGVVSGTLLLLIWIRGVNATSTCVPPSGFTLIEEQGTSAGHGYAIYYKVAGGSEPSSYTVEQTANFSTADRAFMITYDGADETTPIDAEGTKNQDDGTTSPDVLSVTAATADTTLVALCLEWSGADRTLSAPSGMTNRSTRTASPSWAVADVAVSSSGATGNKEFSAGTNANYYTFGFLLKGAGGGGGSSTTPLNVISPSQGIAFASAARRFC